MRAQTARVQTAQVPMEQVATLRRESSQPLLTSWLQVGSKLEQTRRVPKRTPQGWERCPKHLRLGLLVARWMGLESPCLMGLGQRESRFRHQVLPRALGMEAKGSRRIHDGAMNLVLLPVRLDSRWGCPMELELLHLAGLKVLALLRLARTMPLERFLKAERME